jgi:serine/threonine protein kinase
MTDDHDLVGQRVREYEMLELVGRGGMGAVYRARHVLLQEERAVKVVSRRPADDREFTQRFIREARVLSRLRDEHLVRLYEFWEDKGQLFMALEFLRGESVAQRLKARRRFTVAEAAAIARDAARGLRAAHEQSVVHRDISPDNLQLVRGPDGERVKVMDFGIAKALEETGAELTANLFLGKLEYASPEQCGYGLERGESIDWRSDIYSLGVTIFKMVTGSLPFNADTPHGYLFKHAAEAPPPPSAIAPDAGIPADLDRLVLKALAKRRVDRQQSMGELIGELEALLAAGTEVPPPTLATPPPEPTQRPAGTGASDSTGTGTGKTGALTVGESFARRYVIQSQLGAGGMGVVYRALDTILDEPVALKVISERLVGGQEAVERLKREVVLARRVSHPNVCRIFDIGESESGTPYVSMEFVDGSPLRDLIAQPGPFDLAEGVRVVRQVLDALSAAHRVNVIHRDLKPDNVMIAADGRAVIMDFGLSLSEDSRRVTRAGSVIGTPHYMAPEQIRGQGVDPRTDLYAIGVILFRMFTGRLPFAGSIIEVLRGHLETPPPRPSELNPALPPLLETIVLTALEKDPARRFASAEDFLQALDAFEPSPGRPSGETERPRRGARTESQPLRTEADREVVKRYLADATVAQRQALPELTLHEAASTRVAPASRPPAHVRTEAPLRTETRTQPAAPAAAARRSAIGIAAGAAALLLAASIGWHLTRRSPPGPTTSVGDLPGTQPAITAPDASAPPTVRSPSPPTISATAPPMPAPAGPARPAPTTAPPTLRAAPPTTLSGPPVTAPPPTAPPATMVEAPAPATAPPATAPPQAALTPEQGVRLAIAEFASALSRLDREGVRRIFPNFPDRNFEGLANFKAYHVDVEIARIAVEASRVVVEARTRHTFTAFSGKQESRSQKEKMVFIEGARGWVRVE